MPQWTQLAGQDPELHGPPGTGKRLTTEAFVASLGKKIMLVSIADLESKFMGAEVERRSQTC
ncbi:AAA family ATPase [Pseudomonas qingdaonensis]|uniref:AAA family ATPase n=1 Tax=Pseudomonas qingdaonensis TaxID=2056231 RepID=UPI00197E450A|nr:AAA family ATPase [Pseudomonas qingdaonensis]